MARKFSRILITGTHSGLGKSVCEHYREAGTEVLTINRKESEDPNNTLLDISDANQVASYLSHLKATHRLPDLFLLNAGINRVDMLEQLDLNEFNEVMRVNLLGVLTFVSALQQLHIQGRTIAVLSSTSNIVPNPAHLGYFLSKLALKEIFALLSKRDPGNKYKVVILSPVRTNIMGAYPAPKGLQGKIFNLLAVNPSQATPALAHFFEGNGRLFHYTRRACFFYFMVRQVLKVFPKLYRGTVLEKPLSPIATLTQAPSV